MTPTEHLIGFIAMAVLVTAVLVVGTLAAADILHFRPRRPALQAAQVEKRDRTK